MSTDPLSPAALGTFLDVAAEMVDGQPTTNFADEAVFPWAIALSATLTAKLLSTDTEVEPSAHNVMVADWLDAMTAELERDGSVASFADLGVANAAIKLTQALMTKLRAAVDSRSFAARPLTVIHGTR